MQYFDAYLMQTDLEPGDREGMPPGLRALAIRAAPPPGKPETGFVFFGEAEPAAFGRILEAVWLDRRFVPDPGEERRLYLVGEGVYLQAGADGNVEQVGGEGPIRGAVEGFRDHLTELLGRLAASAAVRAPTPLGMRPARYVEVRLPDPSKGVEPER